MKVFAGPEARPAEVGSTSYVCRFLEQKLPGRDAASPRLSRSRRFALPLGLALSVMMAVPGWAQMMPNAPLGAGNIATGRRSQAGAGGPEKAPMPAPEAIPGARAREPAAPATRAASDMQPTDALFDAINRGDIAAARDALSRGADLNGVNVLGLSPMELSVDLGRNDISFLLLSMRGEDSGRGSRAMARGNTPATAPRGASPVKTSEARTDQTRTAQTRTTQIRTTQGKTAQARTRSAGGKADAIEARRSTPPAAAPPKLFANDGGAPLPNVGFLGFGSRPATN